jgi:hypothetical protein
MSLPCLAQKIVAHGDPSDALVHWDKKCIPKGCILMTDVLRGISDDPAPPNAGDWRNYIGIYVRIDRDSRKPEWFAFHMPPGATMSDGVFFAFTKTDMKDGKHHAAIDADGATRLPYDGCDENSCFVRIKDGFRAGATKTGDLDLLSKFMSSTSVLFLYTQNGRAYRTMVLLSSFKKEYARVLN